MTAQRAFELITASRFNTAYKTINLGEIVMAKLVKIAATIVIIIVAVIGIFIALTYPREIFSHQVSFNIGYDSTEQPFQIPILDNQAQVQVTITSGSTLWRTTITDPNGTEVFSHAASQASQTSYTSDWIILPSGNYNITFQTLGFGNVQGTVRVNAKGGFW